jgi:hypothetical protein
MIPAWQNQGKTSHINHAGIFIQNYHTAGAHNRAGICQ